MKQLPYWRLDGKSRSPLEHLLQVPPWFHLKAAREIAENPPLMSRGVESLAVVNVQKAESVTLAEANHSD